MCKNRVRFQASAQAIRRWKWGPGVIPTKETFYASHTMRGMPGQSIPGELPKFPGFCFDWRAERFGYLKIKKLRLSRQERRLIKEGMRQQINLSNASE